MICNVSKDPIDYYASRIIIPESIDLDNNFDDEYSFNHKTCDQIIGSNCFEEVLSEWDFRIYLGNKYESVVKATLRENFISSLKFYSKRLKIAIFSDSMDGDQKESIRKLMIVDLRGRAKPIVIQNSMRIPFIRTFKD